MYHADICQISSRCIVVFFATNHLSLYHGDVITEAEHEITIQADR